MELCYEGIIFTAGFAEQGLDMVKGELEPFLDRRLFCSTHSAQCTFILSIHRQEISSYNPAIMCNVLGPGALITLVLHNVPCQTLSTGAVYHWQYKAEQPQWGSSIIGTGLHNMAQPYIQAPNVSFMSTAIAICW